MKKDNGTLIKKAKDYRDHLEILIHLVAKGGRIPKKYLEWSLQDCLDMHKFYSNIECGRLKLAYNKLNYLGKQCGLVPSDIDKELFNMFSPNKL